MSLKQRATQCSGYIPASQYVPVYARRAKNGRYHEEISPITPKPTFDDPYDARNRSIHEAVKLWLESSPNSVIGPAYRCRSPSSGSPPSHSPSAAAIPSGSSASPVNRNDCPPSSDADNNRNQDASPPVLSPIQERFSVDRISPNNGSGSNRNAAIDKTPKKSSVGSLISPEKSNFAALSERSSSDLRTVSKEFDSVLAAAAIANDKANSSKTSGVRSIEPPALPPELSLKPPRRNDIVSDLEEGDKNSASKSIPLREALHFKNDLNFLDDGTSNNSASVPVAGEKRTVDEGKTKGCLPAALSFEERRFGFLLGSSSKKLDEIPSAKKKLDSTPRYSSAEEALIAAGSFSNHGGSERIYEASDPYARSWKSAGDISHHRRSFKSTKEPMSPTEIAKEQEKKDKVQAKAAAWENAKNATFLNRYKREESKIHAWEEHKVAKAGLALNKVEMELEKKRAKALERMESEVAKAHKRAEEKRATAESKRAQKAAKAAVQAQIYRVLGKTPASCFCF